MLATVKRIDILGKILDIIFLGALNDSQFVANSSISQVHFYLETIKSIACSAVVLLASYADALWARHAIFLPRGGGRLRDEPKEAIVLSAVFFIFSMLYPDSRVLFCCSELNPT